MKYNIKRLFVLFIAVLFIFTSACQKKKGDNEVIIPSASGGAEQPTAHPQIAAGELFLPIPENAVRDNPYSITTEEMRLMYSLIFESLISVDNEGRLTPSLVQSWTKSADDSSVWILSLRSGVKWHDGKDFKAEDVTYSFNTVKSYLASEGASSYYASSIQKIASVTAKDDYKVEVKMKSGGYSSLYSLNFPIICKATWESEPLNGTGPYRVEENKSKSLTLGINSYWWKKLPNIKTIRFKERLNNETALASYDAGQLNFVPTSSLSAGKYRKEGETEVLDIMTQDAELLMFNYKNTLLYNMNIRRAIAYALSQSKLITNIYMNKARSCDVPIAPDSWLYLAKSKVIEQDLNAANEYLDNAGFLDTDGDGIRELGNGSSAKLSFKLLVNESTDNTVRKNAAETIADQLKECGIEIIVESEEYTLNEQNSKYIDRLKNGDFDIALTGVCIGRDCDLTEFFEQDGDLNFGSISDDELLTMAKDIISAEDEASMRAKAYEFQTAFVEKIPFIVLYFRLNSVVYSSELTGLSSVREPDIMYTVDSWCFDAQ